MKQGRLLRAICIAVAAVPAAGLALAACAPIGWFPAVLASHWAGHLAVLSLPLWCLIGQRPLAGALILLITGTALWPQLQASHASTAAQPGPAAACAVSANLYFRHPDHGPAIRILADLDPDLLAVIETRPEDRDLLRHDPRWPHQNWQQPRQSGGMALLSRWPMRASGIELAQATGIDARIQAPTGPLRVIVLHTWSPRDGRRTSVNHQQLDELAGLVATEPGPLLVMGDLNASPATAGLRILRAEGLQPPYGGEVRTWPDWLGPFGIAIDHIMSRNLPLGDASAIDLPGSDHHGIQVRFGSRP